uniref:Protein kinase domain-containing protein n=1 Tax=Caenorhabditis japonica TaxID=281687 RepID=A0A8R1DZ83_CAEJA
MSRPNQEQGQSDEDYRMEVHRLQKMMNNMSCAQQQRPLGLQDFSVSHALGKGAYGNVYRVRNNRDGKDYALKQILISSKNEGIPQSVLREITVMKHLAKKNHPNIVGLKSVFHIVDEQCGILKINMIMEKCDWDLHTFLRNIPRTIPEHQARHVTAQIVRGLDFLHSHSIVHRDLKPQNILLNRDQTVKLADFGLSKEHSNTTAFTTLVVTLWYRAPEVLLQSYYTSTIDMWALGCIVSEIYSRQPLFAGQDEAQQLTDIFKKWGTPTGKDWPSESVIDPKSYPIYKRKSLQELNRHMSPLAMDFVDKCLSYDRIKRISARAALNHPFMKPPVMRRVLQPLHANNK